MERLAPPDLSALTPEQQRVADAIASGPRGGVHGPLAIWLHRPEFAAAAQTLGRFCRYETLLPARLSELAILVTARVWSSEFEWVAHKREALKASLSPDVIEAIRTGAPPPFSGDDERVVAAFAHALHTERSVSDALYAEARTVLGEAALVDLTAILGYYGLVSMTINVFQVPSEGTPELTDAGP